MLYRVRHVSLAQILRLAFFPAGLPSRGSGAATAIIA
jgi:hypothetical protein